MIEEQFYATVKLVSGEEIFSVVQPCDEDDRILLYLENPVTIEAVVVKNMGFQGFKVDPWLQYADDDVCVISMDRVITISEVKNTELITVYKKFVDQYKRRNRKSEITPEMGYLSKISDARIRLEKLYRDQN